MPANLIQDPSFVTGTPWVFSGRASRFTGAGYDDSFSALVQNLKSSVGPVDAEGRVFQDFTVPDDAVGQAIPFSAQVSSSGADERPLEVFLTKPPSTGRIVAAALTAPPIASFPAWSEEEAFEHTFDEAGVYRLTFLADNRSTLGGDVYLVDDVSALYYTAEELMAKSNLETFLANLKSALEALDSNIGTAFVAPRRWRSARELSDDGGVVTIASGGAFDPDEIAGEQAIRVWILEGHLRPGVLTTGTIELRGDVIVTAFWGHKDGADENQADALRDACDLVVSTLSSRASEMTDLAAGMGSGYCGFLGVFPSMGGPVQPASLESGARGWMAQLSVSYFEEIAR